jgi:hypothetical protein
MAKYETDDELWKRSQLDNPLKFEERECRYSVFKEAVLELLRELNNDQIEVSRNADIVSLTKDRRKPWWKYVDPAGSASNGTTKGTAIFLYECLYHQFTIGHSAGSWVLYLGHNTLEIVDVEDLEKDDLEILSGNQDQTDEVDVPNVTREEAETIAADDIATEFDAETIRTQFDDVHQLIKELEDRIIDLEYQLKESRKKGPYDY